jgi:hypothetical protein
MRWRPSLLVALLAAGLAGCGGGADASRDTHRSDSAPSSSLRSLPGAGDETPVPIEAGTYLLPRSAWSVAGLTVTFADGWTVQHGHVFAQHADEADELGFYAVVVDEVFADACRGEGGTTRSAGRTVADLVAALRGQTGGAAVSEPVTTTLGGRPVTRLDLRIPKDLDVTKCQMASYGFTGLQVWHSEPADKYFVLLPGALASVYVVDVKGKRQVFLAQVGDRASAEDRAELRAALDSIHVES